MQERESFGTHGACAAVAVAMKQHLHHEEAAIFSCQAVRSLCSCGDEINQRLLRRAGVCDLVALVLKASVPTSTAPSSQSQLFGSDSLDSLASADGEVRGMFSQIISKARSSFIAKTPSVDRSFSSPNSRSLAVTPPQAIRLFGAGFGAEWKEKLRVSLAAVRAISCLTSNSNPDRDGDDAGSNSTAKAQLGEEGVVEIMVEIGTGTFALGEGRDRDPTMALALAQWISLALCHLVDPSDDNNNAFNDDDLDYFSMSRKMKALNLNLNRLCFCNRSGEFLVNSVLSCAASGSGVAQGDVDALIYNALSVMVSMCEDRVGNHKILSADGLSKMILQLMARLITTTSGTENKWLMVLCLSLASSSALSLPLAEALVQGGFCKMLASVLLTTLLPAALRAIQMQSSTDLSRSYLRPSSSYSGHSGALSHRNSISEMEGVSVDECSTDDRMVPNNSESRQHPRAGSISSDAPPRSRSLTQLQMLRSDFEVATFTRQVVRREGDSRGHRGGSRDGSRDADTVAELRVTSAIRSSIEGNNSCTVRDAGDTRYAYDPESSEVLALVLAREACNALTLLLTSTSIAGGLQSERASQEAKGLPKSRSRSFSTSVGLYRDNGGNIAGIAGGVAGGLVDALSTVLLVADSSILFFGGSPRLPDLARGSESRGDYSREDHARDNVSPSSVLLPAVKELRLVVQTAVRCIQQQQPQQRRNIL